MNTKLVIFDLDGTLLNTIFDLAISCNYVLSLYNYPQHTIEEYCSFVGNGISKLVERAIPEDCRLSEHVNTLRNQFLDYYKEHIADETIPYNGIPQLLRELQERKIMLAIASNKFQNGAEFLVKKIFPDIDFVAIFGQRDNFPIKPDPSIVNEILDISKIDKKDVLYVGDSGVDMQTAHNANITAVAVTWGFRSREELLNNKADFIIDNPDELIKLIDKLQ